MKEAHQDWVVLKFGGTSVSSRQRWETIADVVRGCLAEGLRPFVVCSALSGISDALETLLAQAVRGEHGAVLDEVKARHTALAEALGVEAAPLLDVGLESLSRLALGASLVGEASPRLRAQVMAMGELLSTRLGAAYLAGRGFDVHWRDARTLLYAVEEANAHEARQYLASPCDYQPDPALQHTLAEAGAGVYLTQGFIAGNAAGETVLLGRGGSDTSAAYFAAKLQARRLEIWTDVPGLFTANPRQVPSARLLRRLGYYEAQELATMGAKVLHPRCLEPVRRYHIPLHIRCTEAPRLEGTVIAGDAPETGAQVKAISAKTGVTLVSMDTIGMWQQVGFLADVFAIFKRSGLSIDLVATSETNVTVSLDPMANALDKATIADLRHDLNAYCTARTIGPCAVVSLVGRNIRAMLHRLGPALAVFNERHIYLVSQAASDLNISFVVDEHEAAHLVPALHAALFDKRTPDALLGPSWRECFQ